MLAINRSLFILVVIHSSFIDCHLVVAGKHVFSLLQILISTQLFPIYDAPIRGNHHSRITMSSASLSQLLRAAQILDPNSIINKSASTLNELNQILMNDVLLSFGGILKHLRTTLQIAHNFR